MAIGVSKRWMRVCCGLSGAAISVLAARDARASLLGSCALNGVSITESSTLQYLPAVGPADSNSGSAAGTATPSSGPSTVVTSTANLVPTSGAAKDKIQLRLMAFVTYGAPIGTLLADSLRFKADGSASAVSATNSAGNPASAFVHATITETFFLNNVPGVPGGCAGNVVFPPLRPLNPFDSVLQVTVLKNGTPIATLSPGGTSLTTVPLSPNNTYTVQLVYQMSVPHGVDPPISVDYAAQISAAAPK